LGVQRASGFVALALAGGVVLATSVASAASFTSLGFMPDGTESYARDLSNDGSVVVGYGFIPPGPGEFTGFRAFRWTPTDGMVSLGTLPGGEYSTSLDVNDDGSVVAGWSGTPTNDHAFRWINDSMQDLGTLPGHYYSNARGVSDNGSVVVGRSGTTSNYFRAYRWTGDVMTDLGVLSGYVASAAYGVSGDGLVVVGYCKKSQANTNLAFRWKNGAMTSLGKLKGGAYSEAWAANDIGSVVVGTSGSSSGDRAFRWTNNKMTSLGTLSGQPYSYGLAVSGDGSKVVGYSSDGTLEEVGDSGSLVSTGRAFLWTSALGMVDLNTYLPILGIDLTGWTLREARGISADGSTLVGWGWHDDGINGPRPEAWVAHLQ